MAKKFRVRFLSDTTENLKNKKIADGNLGNCEQGEIFIEKRKLGSNRLLTAGESRSIETSDLATYRHYMSLNGSNFVDSGLHVIDAKAFAPYVQGDIKQIREIDLNKYIEGGFYYIRGEAIPTAPNTTGGILLINSPYPHKKDENIPYSEKGVNGPNFAGYLQVIEWDSNYCKQIFLKQGSEQIFVREKLGENWSDWKEVATSENSNIYKSLIIKDGSIDKDLNNYTIKGTYYFSEVNSPLNKPDDNDKNGFLIVIHKGLRLNQIWVNSDTKNFNYYIRQGVQNETSKEWTFGNWKKTLTEGEHEIYYFKSLTEASTDFLTKENNINKLDLDKIITSGNYHIKVPAVSPTQTNDYIMNSPGTVVNGFLIVFKTGNAVRQMIFRIGQITSSDNAFQIWTRYLVLENNKVKEKTDWRKILTEYDNNMVRIPALPSDYKSKDYALWISEGAVKWVSV